MVCSFRVSYIRRGRAANLAVECDEFSWGEDEAVCFRRGYWSGNVRHDATARNKIVNHSQAVLAAAFGMELRGPEGTVSGRAAEQPPILGLARNALCFTR